MKHRNSHFAVGYWSRLRRGRAVPDQADVDPKALKRLLPFIFLLDARDDGSFIYRLAGTTLCERYGGELRGRNFLSHWDSESRGRLGTLLRAALTTHRPVCLTSIGATEDCRMVEIETVLMPISFGRDAPERFLAVAQILTDVAPLAGRSISFERLVTSALVNEDDAASVNAEPPLPPPPPPAILGAERAARRGRRAHLRLVVSQHDAVDSAADPLGVSSETLRKFLDWSGLAPNPTTKG